MAFGQLNQSEQPMADINITPMVDVMLVLLIIFMITVPVITQSIPLQLPKTSAQHDPDTPDPVRLYIDDQGQYFLADQPVDLQQLKTELQQYVEDPEARVTISADKNVAYDFVIQALSTVKDAGILKVGFITEQQ